MNKAAAHLHAASQVRRGTELLKKDVEEFSNPSGTEGCVRALRAARNRASRLVDIMDRMLDDENSAE